MKVIIPVAGTGTRLRPHTYSLPKPLLHVAGRAIIDHVLEPVVALQPEEVVFVVGYKGDRIREHVSGNYTFKTTFITQDRLLGLGYALNLAMGSVGDTELLIVLGDTIVTCDLGALISAGENVLGLRSVDDPGRFGIAEVTGGRVVRLEEKPEQPRSDLAVIGLYYFRDSSLLRATLNEHVTSGKTTRGEIQFTDALQSMIEQGAVFVPFEVSGWYDCGKKETMLATNRHLLASLTDVPVIDGSTIIPPVFVAPSAIVRESVIGPNVSISDGTTVIRSVLSDTIVGRNSHVENAALDHSIVGHEARMVGSNATVNVGDSSEVEW